MRHIQSHQLRAAQVAGEADQEQRPVARAGQRGAAGLAQLSDLGRGQGRRPASGCSVLAPDAAERLADRRVLGIKRLARAIAATRSSTSI